jgi:general secretion pathway protein M
MMNSLKQYYQSLNTREQKIVWLATPLVLFMILWLAVINPQLENHRQLSQQLEKKQSDWVWMQQAASQLKGHSSTGGQMINGEDLRRVATQLFAQQKITLSRIQNGRDNELSLWADQVIFDRLLNVLQALQQQGVSLASLQLTPTTPGHVNMRLTLTVSGA